MKKKIIIISSIVILLAILASVFFIIKNKKTDEEEPIEEEKVIDISSYVNETTGIYIVQDEGISYAVAIYTAAKSSLIDTFTVDVTNANSEVVETINMELYNDTYSKDLDENEKTIFIGKLTKDYDPVNQYKWNITFTIREEDKKYIANGIDVRDYVNENNSFTINSNGIIICKYTNKTESNVEVENCSIVFKDYSNRLIENLIALPSYTTVKPGDTVYFAAQAKNYSSNVSIENSTFDINIKE